jgi:hypothetical protein
MYISSSRISFAVVLAAAVAATTGCPPTPVPEIDPNAGTEEGGTPITMATPAEGTPVDHAAKNTLYMCPRVLSFPPLTRPATPWIDGDSVVIAEIPFVDGAVEWDAEFEITTTATERKLVGNGLPPHPTGEFPVQEGTDAYEWYAGLPVEGYANAA